MFRIPLFVPREPSRRLVVPCSRCNCGSTYFSTNQMLVVNDSMKRKTHHKTVKTNLEQIVLMSNPPFHSQNMPVSCFHISRQWVRFLNFNFLVGCLCHNFSEPTVKSLLLRKKQIVTKPMVQQTTTRTPTYNKSASVPRRFHLLECL